MVNSLSRIAVPFFFVSAGYMFSKNISSSGQNYLNIFLKNMLLLYLFWSLIYIPIGIIQISQGALIDASISFISALILAIIIMCKLQTILHIKSILIASFLLLILGSTETYYGLFSDIFALGSYIYQSTILKPNHIKNLYLKIFFFIIILILESLTGRRTTIFSLVQYPCPTIYLP